MRADRGETGDENGKERAKKETSVTHVLLLLLLLFF
jgi:hypothetical protein